MEVANFEFSHYMRKPPKVVHIFSGGSDTITRKLASGLLHSIKDITRGRGIFQVWTETQQRAWSIKGRTTLTPKPINQLHHHQHHKNNTKTNPASSRTSRINRFRWSLQFPASATISKSPSNFGIAKCMKKARTNSWKELNTQKKPTAWLFDCWTTQQKKHPKNQKSLRIIGPFLWVSSKKCMKQSPSH